MAMIKPKAYVDERVMEGFFSNIDMEHGLTPDVSVPAYRKLGKCWAWKGAKLQTGYAALHDGFGGNSAHRISYKIHHGHIDGDLVVRHRCDNKECTNPEHLVLGTKQQNIEDYKERRLVSPTNTSSRDDVALMCVAELLYQYEKAIKAVENLPPDERFPYSESVVKDAISSFAVRMFRLYAPHYLPNDSHESAIWELEYEHYIENFKSGTSDLGSELMKEIAPHNNRHV